jgi:hypothetical protein
MKNLNSRYLEGQEEICVGTYNPPKLKQKDIKNFNRSIMSKEIVTVIKNFLTTKKAQACSILPEL